MEPKPEEAEYQTRLDNVQVACDLIWQELIKLRSHPGRGTGPLYPNPNFSEHRWKPVLDNRAEPEAIREMREAGQDHNRRKAACGALVHFVVFVNLQAALHSYRSGKRAALFAQMAQLKRDLMLVLRIRMRPNLRDESLEQLSESIRSRRGMMLG